jgi:hypothetical protein
MTPTTRKRIMLGLALAAVAIALAVIFVWNKPHRDAASEKGTPVTAAELQQAYGADEAAANAKYLDKTLEVSGTVAGMEKNQDGKTVLYLDDPMSGVGCTLIDAAASAKEGEAVVVKGFCSGSNGMGVAMRECVLVNE